jgi:hypothetical protein
MLTGAFAWTTLSAESDGRLVDARHVFRRKLGQRIESVFAQFRQQRTGGNYLFSLHSFAPVRSHNDHGSLTDSQQLFSRDSNMYSIKDGADYVRGIFNRYLETGSYQNYLVHCHRHYEKFTHITEAQISAAISASMEELQRYRAADAVIVRATESARFASRFIQQLAWETRFAELITENLIKT